MQGAIFCHRTAESEFLAVADDANCIGHVRALNEILKSCAIAGAGGFVGSGNYGNGYGDFACKPQGSVTFLSVPLAQCAVTVDVVNDALLRFRGPEGVAGNLKCSTFEYIHSPGNGCEAAAASLNQMVRNVCL